MKFHPWLSTCTIFSTTTIGDGPSPPPETSTPSPKHLLSDTSSCSDMRGSASTTSQETSSSISSLQSNLSLLTLPSVPSLQKLSPENLNLSITTLCLTSFKPNHAGHVNFLAVNKTLLYAASGNVVNVFEIINFNLVDQFSVADPSSGSVKSITFCDEKVFTAHQDCKIRIWKTTMAANKLQQHKLIATLPTLEDRLRHVLLPKNYVKVRRHKKKLWVEHHDAVSGLAMAAENLLYSVSWDRCVKIWRAKDMRCIESIKAHDDAINAVVVSFDGMIYTGSADTRIKIWRKPIGEKKYVLIATLEKHKSAVNALALNTDGSVLFSGSNDRSILVWEREDSANHMVVTGALRGHSRAILCLVNVSDLLFSGSADRTVRIWQRGHDGRYCCLAVLDGHEKPVRSLAAVADTSESNGTMKVVSGSFDGEIKVWQVVISSSVRSP